MITKARARALRRLIEKASTSLSDADAYGGAELFPRWSDSAVYAVGDRVRYEETLYKCLQAHTAQPTWTPADSPSLWLRVDDPSVEYPDWVQPTGSTDAYRIGAKVSHLDRHWVSAIDYNTYEPSVYGWSEV